MESRRPVGESAADSLNHVIARPPRGSAPIIPARCHTPPVPEKPEHPDRPEKPERSERPEHPDRPGRVEVVRADAGPSMLIRHE